MAEWKATLRKIEEGTSITWEIFVAFLCIYRVTADGCTCANYCTFAMCEGVLLWLLVREANFKVPSQYSRQIVAQRPFKLGRIVRNVTSRAEPSTKVRTRKSEKFGSKKKALAESRRKVVAGRDTNSDANVSTLALNPPSDDESTSTTVAAPMEVHQRTWHCLNLFRPLYVCGQCHKTVYLWCMHCEGCGFCLHTLECPGRGRAHPNTDKWLFQKWCQEVDVEEVLTATLPNEPMSGDEELGVFSNPLLASPPGKEVKKKEVRSSDSEVDLFAPPTTAPVPQKKVKGKKALPSAPPPEGEGKEGLAKCPPKGEGKEGLAKCTPCRPSHFQKVYSKHHPELNNPFWGWEIG